MTAILSDIRFSLRFLRINAGFASTAITVIALGIALSTTLFAVVKGALLDPWPYDGYERLVTVTRDLPEQGRRDFSLWSPPEIEDLRTHADVFDYVIAGDARNVNLDYQGRPERVRAAVITPNAFAMLNVPASLGRVLLESDAVPGASAVVVVSHDFWRNRLNAEPAIIGRTLRIGDTPYQVVGVMPSQFKFWDRQLWLPLALDPGAPRSRRDLYVQARLHPTTTVALAQARMSAALGTWAQRFGEAPEYRGMTVSFTPLVEAVLRDLRFVLYFLLLAVAGVLLAAAANVANAMLAKAFARDGELAVRRALGATAAQLARQLVIESLVISVAGALIGVALAAFLLPQIVARIPYGFVPAEADVRLDAAVLIAAVGVAIMCGLLSAIVPTVRAVVADPSTLLRRSDTRTMTGRSNRFRAALIGAQLVMAVIVVGFALTAFSSTRQVLLRHPGFDPSGIWTARLALPPGAPASRAIAYDRIVRELRQTTAFESAVLASSFPVAELPRTLVSASALTGSPGAIDSDILSVTPGFFALLDIRLVDGRQFTERDRNDAAPAVIVSAGLASRLWPGGNAVGSRLFIGDADPNPITVVGVVRDVVTNAAEAGSRPTVFAPLAQRPPTTAVVGLKSANGGELLSTLTRAVANVDPQIPVFGAEMLSQTREAVIGPQLLAVLLLGLFGGTVLVLSAIGLYAVISQSVQERAREISIRMTFGATPVQMFTGEMLRAARVVAISAAVGGIATIAGLRFADAAALAAGGWWPVLVAAAAVSAVAMLATSIPAYRASRVLVRALAR